MPDAAAPPAPPVPPPQYTPPPPPVAPQYLPGPYSPHVVSQPAPAPAPVYAPPPAPAPVAPAPAPVAPAPAPKPVKPAEVRRAKDAPLAARHGATIPEGAKLYVEANDAFFGLRFGACTATFEKGVHTIAEELEDGWFVSKNGYEFPVEEPLGILEDNHGNKAKLDIKAAIRLKIDEPGDFAAAMADKNIDLDQMTSRVRSKVRDLVDGEVRDLLAKDRYFTSLRSKKATDEIGKEVRLKWAGDPDCDPFTSIEVLRLDLPSEPVKGDEPTPEFAPPPPNPSVAPGTPMKAASVAPAPPATPEPPPPPAGPLAPQEGARVEVDWGNGQFYAATVRAAGALVRFDDGQEHWIPLDRLKLG